MKGFAGNETQVRQRGFSLLANEAAEQVLVFRTSEEQNAWIQRRLASLRGLGTHVGRLYVEHPFSASLQRLREEFESHLNQHRSQE